MDYFVPLIASIPILFFWNIGNGKIPFTACLIIFGYFWLGIALGEELGRGKEKEKQLGAGKLYSYKKISDQEKLKLQQRANAALDEEREIQEKQKLSLESAKALYQYLVKAGQIKPENYIPEERLDEELQKIIDEEA